MQLKMFLLACIAAGFAQSSRAFFFPKRNMLPNAIAKKKEFQGLTTTGRIVGGTEASNGDFPFMLLLIAEDIASGIFISPCGGSLIAPDTVLSAAHCFDTSGSIVYRGVLIGDLTPYDPTDSGHYIPLSGSPIVHPNFDENTFENDVMILRLSGSSSFKPIQLIFEQADFDQLRTPGTAVEVAGWGTTTSNGIPSDRLRSVDLVISAYSECDAIYGTIPQDKMICAWHPPGGKDSCQGDSGGPLFYANAHGDFIQVGIVSFGVSCALPSTPGVYSNVANYESFILSNSGDLGATPPASASGTATNPLPRAPLGWVCPASFYFASPDGFCDCGCGLTDVDCPSGTLFCNGIDQPGAAYQCSSNLCRRTSGSVTIPQNWQCSMDFYSATDGCDCECGAHDPDCDVPGQTVFNCNNAGDVCIDGICHGTLQQGGPFTEAPTIPPVEFTSAPSGTPTELPTSEPTTQAPSSSPTTGTPTTGSPSDSPTTAAPTDAPTGFPTRSPQEPSSAYRALPLLFLLVPLLLH